MVYLTPFSPIHFPPINSLVLLSPFQCMEDSPLSLFYRQTISFFRIFTNVFFQKNWEFWRVHSTFKPSLNCILIMGEGGNFKFLVLVMFHFDKVFFYMKCYILVSQGQRNFEFHHVETQVPTYKQRRVHG